MIGQTQVRRRECPCERLSMQPALLSTTGLVPLVSNLQLPTLFPVDTKQCTVVRRTLRVQDCVYASYREILDSIGHPASVLDWCECSSAYFITLSLLYLNHIPSRHCQLRVPMVDRSHSKTFTSSLPACSAHCLLSLWLWLCGWFFISGLRCASLSPQNSGLPLSTLHIFIASRVVDHAENRACDITFSEFLPNYFIGKSSYD